MYRPATASFPGRQQLGDHSVAGDGKHSAMLDIDLPLPPPDEAVRKLLSKVGGTLQQALDSRELKWSSKELDADDAKVVAYVVAAMPAGDRKKSLLLRCRSRSFNPRIDSMVHFLSAVLSYYDLVHNIMSAYRMVCKEGSARSV